MIKQKNKIIVYKPQSKALSLQTTAWNSLSLESQKAYNYDFKLFFKIVGKDLNQVSANDILSFIEYLRNNNYKNSSINRKVASLSKMFKVLVVSGKIKQNPVDTLKQFRNISMKVEKEIKLSLTMQDIRKAIKSKSPADIKMIILVRMLVKTGLRISEMIHITKKDIKDHDTGNKIIRIVGKGRKERFIFLDNEFLSEIKKVFPDKKGIDYLFYTNRNDCYDRRVLCMQMAAFFKRTIDKHVHPHQLRHLFISHKISIEKMDIKSVSLYAGHSSTSITLDMYVDTALNVKQAQIKI